MTATQKKLPVIIVSRMATIRPAPHPHPASPSPASSVVLLVIQLVIIEPVVVASTVLAVLPSLTKPNPLAPVLSIAAFTNRK